MVLSDSDGSGAVWLVVPECLQHASRSFSLQYPAMTTVAQVTCFVQRCVSDCARVFPHF